MCKYQDWQTKISLVKFQGKYRVESHRLKEYDYASESAYFITICTKDRAHLFGEIVHGKMMLNALGKSAEKCWQNVPKHFSDVVLDEFVIMPNHIHGILFFLLSEETKNFLSLLRNKFSAEFFQFALGLQTL